jgi:CDP-diacylglycerol--serine O-phosphatidyltransferase
MSSIDRPDQVPAEVASRKPGKGLYVLPNLFTLAALFGGFYAIVMAMNGNFGQAAIGVFCAMVLDSLEGRALLANKWTLCPTWCLLVQHLP